MRHKWIEKQHQRQQSNQRRRHPKQHHNSNEQNDLLRLRSQYRTQIIGVHAATGNVAATTTSTTTPPKLSTSAIKQPQLRAKSQKGRCTNIITMVKCEWLGQIQRSKVMYGRSSTHDKRRRPRRQHSNVRFRAQNSSELTENPRQSTLPQSTMIQTRQQTFKRRRKLQIAYHGQIGCFKVCWNEFMGFAITAKKWFTYEPQRFGRFAQTLTWLYLSLPGYALTIWILNIKLYTDLNIFMLRAIARIVHITLK